MNKVLGIDISKWQDDNSTPQKMNLEKAKEQGAEFVFIKACERMYVDGDFIWNWKSAKEAGLLRGAYHFLRWDVSGKMQARFICDALGNDIGELPIVADFEAPPKYRNGKISHYPSNALLFQFLEEVENITGKKPMIYTSAGFWNSHGKKKGTNVFDSKWLYYPLWVANYGVSEPLVPKPWKKWTFWQYSATGDGLKFGAESKSLDMNWYNGDLMSLYAFAGQGEITPPEEPTPPPLTPEVAIRVAKLEGRLDILEEWARKVNLK